MADAKRSQALKETLIMLWTAVTKRYTPMCVKSSRAPPRNETHTVYSLRLLVTLPEPLIQDAEYANCRNEYVCAEPTNNHPIHMVRPMESAPNAQEGHDVKALT